jgi:carotenoid epsilon hydroxylase
MRVPSATESDLLQACKGNHYTDSGANLQEEVDRVLGDSSKPSLDQYRELQYTLRCVNESMRLYPHPPVLLRRALVPDLLPGGYSVPKGQDVMISVYNIHRSQAVWDNPHDFKPERFSLDQPMPTELNTDFRRVSAVAYALFLSHWRLVHSPLQ